MSNLASTLPNNNNSTVEEIQRDFRGFVQGHGHENCMGHIKSSDHSKETQLDVYLNNVMMVHKRSLESKYPLVFSILGNKDACKLVQSYVETSLPCTSSLEDWGAGLISFLRHYEPAEPWSYLSEIAQYEWAKHLAYCASENPPLTPEDMKHLTEPDQKEFVFHFQNSCQLLAFKQPLQSIIQKHQEGQTEPMYNVKGSAYALILKHQGIIKVHWLSAALFAFINRLKEGQDIEVAFAAAEVLEPDFDAQEAFSFLLRNPILRK